MFRILLICITYVNHYLVESTVIDYPFNEHIEERIRKDFDSIDSIFRYYIIPREIQFHINAIKHGLPYFLRCKGSHKSINFTVPVSAIEELSFTTDDKTHTITAKLERNQLNTNLVGRYTCSEIINGRKHETTVHVFIQDERSVFTKRLYPKIFKQTGIHFFNLPCQTTNWYSSMSCPISSNGKQCKVRQCNLQERKINEVKCNIPICNGQERCIPVYYTPSDLIREKVFFDPQIGFALENPTIPDTLTYFTCVNNYTPNEESKIPFDSLSRITDHVQIHQSNLRVTSDEILKLTCEIRYEQNLYQKSPTLFWFEDIYNLNLISNQTEKPVFDSKTLVYSRNSSIVLGGFKPNKNYRFYCVRVSDHGLYSHSIVITCVDAPSLNLNIDLSESNTGNEISYGANAIYDITMITIPRSPVVFEISRNGMSLANDKRFEILPIINIENQYFEYRLTIYNVTFDDETDLNVTVSSSKLKKTETIKPNIIGNPIGQFSFIPEQIPFSIPWRNENKLNIYSYGIFPNESYRMVCTIRHRSDIKRPLNIFIQYSKCLIDNCLSSLIYDTCQISSNKNLISSTSNHINNYQTQFISSNSHTLDNPSIGHNYLCCYKQNGLVSVAKAITVLSHNRHMFHINRPEFSLVTGDVVAYRCDSHDLIYNDLQMIYHDGLLTYERSHFDHEWHLKGTNQIKQVDINWNAKMNEYIRSTAIEIKTSQLGINDNNKYFQCIGLSKQPNFISNGDDTYIIDVDDPAPLQFKNNLQTVSQLDRKLGDNVEFDCKFNGRPKPKIIWLKGILPLDVHDSTLQFGDNNESISITHVQTADTGYYTCMLNNGRDLMLERSFNLRVQSTNAPNAKLGRLAIILIIICILILLLMLILLIILSIKYFQIKQKVNASIFHEQQPIGPEDKSQPAISQLSQIPLPDNFASTQQIRTFLSYVSGDHLPLAKDDFKELGRGQFGVVYQVRLLEVGLVAAKVLPETIRPIKYRRKKRKKIHHYFEENEEMISKHEIRKKNNSKMLIEEIKLMHKAGKHINIVALKKVAYPETKLKFLFIGEPIRDEDSFYLMELCSNGSLESMLKYFLQSSLNSTHKKLSLYETLSKQKEPGMTIQQAYEQCILTDDDLKLAAYQVACGIDYLNQKQIIHCDIAPRNVLVNSRFIMKICDFGLATWTTYKNYCEQLVQNESVLFQEKNNEIVTHNLTPELARAFLRVLSLDERLLLNKSSMKSNVWSFGIFLWELFLKCRIRPFNNLMKEIRNRSDEENFFHKLARIISEGHVLQYIDYQPEIPRNIYVIIRECLVEENRRPEMIRIRALLCHSKMLSKQAFEYYRLEYNQYQEENAIDENVKPFDEDQGTSDLSSFYVDNVTDGNSISRNHHSNNDPIFRPTANVDEYQSTIDYSQQERYLWFTPAHNNQQTDTDINESHIPQIHIKMRYHPEQDRSHRHI
ncbi:unnamed protein product [Rotaria sp. Silwood1]|nr:unnamed protein product [Rotaria sp. Silwood1]